MKPFLIHFPVTGESIHSNLLKVIYYMKKPTNCKKILLTSKCFAQQHNKETIK